MGTLFPKGVAAVTAFSGYSFGLLQKSDSLAVRIPQCQNIITQVNAENLKKTKNVTLPLK
jgi:hypothetical protein